MKKLLFIDRDGVLLQEPPHDYQVDSFEKFEMVPGAISALKDIVALQTYELVMVTNQDGLGTDSFPEDTFWGPQNMLLKILENEGIRFRNIHIDRSFAKENKPTRKPGTALLTEYMHGEWNLAQSFVIGDRKTDMLLAKNLGAQGILLGQSTDPSDGQDTGDQDWQKHVSFQTDSWSEIRDFLVTLPRKVFYERETHETSIELSLVLEGSGKSDIQTGLPFFDHMLDQIARHGGLDLVLKVDGDLEIDEHHTIEDTGLALGAAFREAIGSKIGMNRYGFSLPMDDCRALVLLDFGGRPWFTWDVEFQREHVGNVPTEMFSHFFKSFSDEARINLQIDARGENEHHKIEAIFKAFARAIKSAIQRNANDLTLASTKGKL
ncbi:bifunctional histidinol-phosphatase/imidazoleglycerol-phosphate dehydratase HisB [Membranicola marinus]|uniref:Histidine biosynthesis bifunctional protein HisB n=1 Tax=Membranihabitans marinus TaxID=1227546 RepID=A0A953HPJ7_9BACT|nr:bifunctional histidinol-phosphatase/imidazoleglycerol-phosphate dehydratase HisB [Membranihabitans marinus]MBY5958894.1 bifunctional histidinol-phosphatase/imidazoleglycerol-phosphate dehydratase HisB [Membranihabitans marinus]